MYNRQLTYVILDSPVFGGAQTKADLYPQRTDDLSSAIFYRTWNQAIAATAKRFPLIDTYHINGVFWRYNISTQKLQIITRHSSSLSPAQGFAMLSVIACQIPGFVAKEEMKEVCLVFNREDFG